MHSHTQPSVSPQAARPTVRPARITDLPALVELLCQLFSIETDFQVRPARHARGLRLLLGAVRRGRAYVALAETGGEVVGMATVQIVVSTAEGARSGWIEDVVVREDLRGAGIGTSLMADIAHWARVNGLARLQLLTDRRNRPALAFYDRLAFRATHMICLRLGCHKRPQPRGPGEDRGKPR
ncbi:MAG TPA: GNAT family N-acetyltransferase [Polyangia bacterium]|jgi:Acetyltransferases|nr:GNAT family N-acetyltransferase [Polyangia bacterium]